jgi:uncharacterized protein
LTGRGQGDPRPQDRTAVRRLPEKQIRDRATLDAVLDAARVAHVALTDETGQPYVLPVAHARFGDEVLIHGSTGSRLFRGLLAGAPTCLTVTVLDGLVAARSVFESSMRYRSAMVFGQVRELHGDAKLSGLEALTEHLLPGRWGEARRPSAKELAATVVLALSLSEWSVKVSDGHPDDDQEDLDLPVWAGVVPLREVAGEPIPAPDLRVPVDVPAYVRTWSAG